MKIRPSLKRRWLWAIVFVVVKVSAVVSTAAAQRATLAATRGSEAIRSVKGIGGAVVTPADLGAVPGSQMLTLTVLLKPVAERVAALDQQIADQQSPGSASYRHWLVPAEFAANFGATDNQIAAVSVWLESQGLTVNAVPAGKTRLTVTGSAARVQAAFAVELRRYGLAGAVHFANAATASVPMEMAALVAGVSGLDDRPAAPMLVHAFGIDGLSLPVVAATDALSTIRATIDADAAAILTVSSAGCFADFEHAEFDAWHSALRQAEAQGITVLATSGCASVKDHSFPAILAEVTAVAQLPSKLADSAPVISEGSDTVELFPQIAHRPPWQLADGLPANRFREDPDLTADAAALAETLSGISQQAGTRLGNVAPVLYALAMIPGLYAQPDGAPAGTWERTTGLGVVDLRVLAEAFPRGKIGTSSLLVASNYAPYHGKSLTLTATVTSTGGNGIPSGTVTFTSTQQGALGTGTLNAQGIATFTSNSLRGGIYTLTSVYSGDATYTGSTSGTATVTIVGESSIITPTVAAGATVGGNATVNISVTSASGVGTPGGTVAVAPQGTADASTATATLTGTNGTAKTTVLLPVFQAGMFELLVSCTDPDPSFTCYSPVSAQMTVARGASKTTLTASPASPSTGQAYTLTATVSSTAATTRNTQAATGSVQFMDGTTVLGSGGLTAGAATFSGAATTGMQHFAAAFPGDQNYTASNSAGTAASTGLPTDTSLTASSYSISAGQSITLYSTVYSPGYSSTMTGTVTYSAVAQGILGKATVSAGMATLKLNSLPAGTYNMTATYSGDAKFAGSSSTSSVIVTVGQATVTLAGTITPAPLDYGSNALLAATASFATGVVGGPTGTLQAVVSGVTGDTFTAPLTASATGPSSTAKFTFAAPVPGEYSVVLSCAASDTYTCDGPLTVPMTVAKGTTSTTLSLSPTAPVAGASTTLTATIKNLGNNASASNLTGTVQFFVNTKSVGSATVSGGKATLGATLPAGADGVVAIYSGDMEWSTSTSSTTTVNVAGLSTATTLSSNVTGVISGVQVVLTATVAGTTKAAAVSAPSGEVDFYDTYNGVLSKLGSATLASLGASTSQAIFTAMDLSTGTHVTYALYEGDTVYKTSKSGAITLAATDFAASFVPATMTLNRGQTGTATLLVNFEGGFSGSVAFGCTPPANVEITCSFNPAVITAVGTTTLTVGTVAPSARSAERAGMLGKCGGSSVLALLLIVTMPRRHQMKLGLLLALLAIGASSLIGCMGTNFAGANSGSNSPGSPGTTPSDPGSSLGTQILSITTAGSDGTNTVRHGYSYQVTVQ